MIRHLIIDVDGTMTDGSIYYDEAGNEFKKFNTKDAAGFFAATEAGIKIYVITGRSSGATSRRMKELGVKNVFQNITDKYTFLKSMMETNLISKEELGYIGDDLNDYKPMQLAGWIGCPADSCPEIVDIADFVSSRKGGDGAVRDIIEHYLKKNGIWDQFVVSLYGSIIGR